MKRRITITIDSEYPSGRVSRIAETFDERKLAAMKKPLKFLLDTIKRMLKQSKEYIP